MHLYHEAGYDPVKDGALVAESLLVGAECAEILRGLGHHVRPQQDDDPAHHLVADLDVQVYLGHSGDRVKTGM